MPLRDIIERRLVSCSPDTRISRVARMMRDENVGAVLVLEGGKPIGIVTDRDLVVRCITERGDYSNIPVRDVMTEEVECVGPDEGIQNVVDRMKDGEIRRVAVVDDTGKAVGLLSFGDLFALLAAEMHDLSRATTTAREIPGYPRTEMPEAA